MSDAVFDGDTCHFRDSAKSPGTVIKIRKNMRVNVDH